MRLEVRMVSCAERAEVLGGTLASWRESDWGGEPPVALDESEALEIATRIEETWLRALQSGLEAGADVVLLLEDDLRFNRFLRHNLERWAPLLALDNPALPFFGSLYRVTQRMLWQDPAQRFALAAPESFWGAQALLLSRGSARHLLANWPPGGRAHDLKAARLAAEQGPIYCHVPALVQHLAGPSTWGGVVHQAPDFDPDYRAP
ncbi:MAG TPA: hypothetical protein VN914_21255 [Polyangia bacterium]|nr:hypothetical protein [Polyangia bacterium]